MALTAKQPGLGSRAGVRSLVGYPQVGARDHGGMAYR